MTTTPYEATGRREQKARTRDALVGATRQLLADGANPTVEQVAATAGISRTTAYRYFPSQRSLLLAAYPEIEQASLLPPDASDDPYERLELAVEGLLDITVRWEPQLRTALRLSLEPDAGSDAGPATLRQGRAVGWIADALAPLRQTHPTVDIARLAVAVRATVGIEPLVWLTGVAGLDRERACALMHWSARALLDAALADAAADPPQLST